MKHLDKITRVEVIDHQDVDPVKGARKFVKYNCGKVEIDEQDNGQTLKIFISKKVIAKPTVEELGNELSDIVWQDGEEKTDGQVINEIVEVLKKYELLKPNPNKV